MGKIKDYLIELQEKVELPKLTKDAPQEMPDYVDLDAEKEYFYEMQQEMEENMATGN